MLHQMRGEWFDSVSCLVTFAMLALATKPKEVFLFRHTIVRLMSHAHAIALEEITNNEIVIERLDVEGIDEETVEYIRTCTEKYGFNRVETVLKTIYTCMTKALDDKVLLIPPPILTRVYQTLSRGFVQYLNAKKITDTRFPFPYAQLISSNLLALSIAIPAVMSMLIRSALFSGVFTFVMTFASFSLNFIAAELENPFGRDANDLPLETFQAEMNCSLLMLLHGRADHVAGLSDDAILDCNTLARNMNFYRGENVSQDDWDERSSSNKKSARAKHLAALKSGSRLSLFETMDYPSEELGGERKEDKEKRRPAGFSQEEWAVRTLAANSEEFNRMLQRWTRTVENQVGELRRSYTAIKAAVGGTSVGSTI